MLEKLPRLTIWIVIAMMLTVGIGLLAPYQLPVTLYKVSLVVLAAVLGYWVDRSLFPYARPDKPKIDCSKSTAMIRRAIVVSAIIIAIALGA